MAGPADSRGNNSGHQPAGHIKYNALETAQPAVCQLLQRARVDRALNDLILLFYAFCKCLNSPESAIIQWIYDRLRTEPGTHDSH